MSCESEARQSQNVVTARRGSQEQEKAPAGQPATLRMTFFQRTSYRLVSMKHRLRRRQKYAHSSRYKSCPGGACQLCAQDSYSRLRRSFSASLLIAKATHSEARVRPVRQWLSARAVHRWQSPRAENRLPQWVSPRASPTALEKFPIPGRFLKRLLMPRWTYALNIISRRRIFRCGSTISWLTTIHCRLRPRSVGIHFEGMSRKPKPSG